MTAAEEGSRRAKARRLADIREAMADLARRAALLADLKRMAEQVAKEYEEHTDAMREERMALREFVFAFLGASFKKKRHRLAFLEECCEELAAEIVAEKEAE